MYQKTLQNSQILPKRQLNSFYIYFVHFMLQNKFMIRHLHNKINKIKI